MNRNICSCSLCVCTEFTWSLQAETTAPVSLQTRFLPSPGHVPPKTASPPPLQEGKAVPMEPIEEELEEGLIKMWARKLCSRGVPSRGAGGTSAREPGGGSSRLPRTSRDTGRISSSAIFRRHLRLSPATDATRHGARKSAAWQLLCTDSRNIFWIICTICLSQVFSWEGGGGEGHLRARESNGKCFIGQYAL